MRRPLSLLLFLLQFGDVVPTNCIAGYTDMGNGICQSAKRGPSSQFMAYDSCALDNGYILTVGNGFENANVANLAGSSNPIWLGLTCTSSEKTSCLWDNGIPVTNNSFTNFYIGHPNMAAGACVYLAPVSGQWYSSACTGYSAYYICKTSPGVNVSMCPAPSYYFRGHCYYPLNAIGYGTAVSTCSSNCGNITSIHNDGENSYVRDVALSNYTRTIYTYIGLTYFNGSYQWDDGTQMDYDKFGFKNANLGTCVFMATTDDDVVPRGQWMNSGCNEDTVAICKTALTCPIPTDAPLQCTETEYLSGGGDIVSPGYPLGSQPNHCQYIITEDPGVTVVFTVQELALDATSTIQVYNLPIDTEPFVTFNSTSHTNNGTAYFATGNFLKIVYVTQTRPTFNGFKNRWRLRYGTHGTGPDHCGSTFSTSPEVISGPHYAQNCTYLLKMGQTTGRTCLRFNSVNVQQNDSISIYDGPVSSQNQIGFLGWSSSSYITRVALCTSTANYLTVTTTGHSGLSYEMFVLTAGGVLSPQSLGMSYYSLSVPCTDQRLASNYYNYYSIAYLTSETNKTVRADLTYLSMPYPDYLFVMDGDNSATVALAFGSLTNSRMTYQSSHRNLTIFYQFQQGGPSSAGYIGTFTAV